MHNFHIYCVKYVVEGQDFITKYLNDIDEVKELFVGDNVVETFGTKNKTQRKISYMYKKSHSNYKFLYYKISANDGNKKLHLLGLTIRDLHKPKSHDIHLSISDRSMCCRGCSGCILDGPTTYIDYTNPTKNIVRKIHKPSNKHSNKPL